MAKKAATKKATKTKATKSKTTKSKTTKKAATQKTTSKKTATKKAAVKKAAVKKAAVKKAAVKKAAVKKAAVKKAPVPKAADDIGEESKKKVEAVNKINEVEDKAPVKKAKPRKTKSMKMPDFDPSWPVPVPDPDADLNMAQLRTLQGQLIRERDARILALKRHVGQAVEDTQQGGDEADVASLHSNQAYLLRVADKEQKLLREIRHALQKMESGEYGVCEGSGDPISYKRLLLRPWTRYSVRHKEELEREKAQRSRR